MNAADTAAAVLSLVAVALFLLFLALIFATSRLRRRISRRRAPDKSQP